MPELESPQVQRDRRTTLCVAGLLFVALPTLTFVILDQPNRDTNARWFVGAALVASVLAMLYWAPYRVLGLVPFSALVWLAAVGHGVYWNEWPGWTHGVPVALTLVAVVRGRRGADSLRETAVLFGAVAVGLGCVALIVSGGRPFSAARWFLLAVSVLLLAVSWSRLFRPAFEFAVEPVLWLLYRVRRAGPGFVDFPRTGPCLVIANHACWLDPVFLAKVLPRPLTPMMTARFYDLPVIRRLMVSFSVIRVPEVPLKKDAPEIQEAIAALDRGECVVIFPEGYLRRSEDKPLKRFGQGVWQILRARPSTPVFAGWIEGSWGSYTSYFNGKPTKNKKLDKRRPLGVGLSAPVVIPPELLAEHLRTRLYLMNLVSAAREHLGLERLPPFELPPQTETESEAENDEPRV